MSMGTETTTKSTTADEVIRRNLDKLRREMGATIRKAMDDPAVIKVMLNPDGTVWTDKLGLGMEYLCNMSEVQALQMLGTIAHMLGTVVNYHNPKVEGELPGDGSRVEGVIPPIAPRPTFNLLELQCTMRNFVSMRTNSDVSMQNLLKIMMRQRPDRIIVGEVRGKEALDMLKAWNTGHPGGVCTVHANDARAGLLRIEQLISEVSESPERFFLASSSPA